MNSSKLKGIRVEKGKTQKNMAELIGKSLVTYSKKERGEVEFSNEEMSIVAKALDLTSVQKASRILKDCKFSARIAGAIHVVEIKGCLTYENL